MACRRVGRIPPVAVVRWAARAVVGRTVGTLHVGTHSLTRSPLSDGFRGNKLLFLAIDLLMFPFGNIAFSYLISYAEAHAHTHTHARTHTHIYIYIH